PSRRCAACGTAASATCRCWTAAGSSVSSRAATSTATSIPASRKSASSGSTCASAGAAVLADDSPAWLLAAPPEPGDGSLTLFGVGDVGGRPGLGAVVYGRFADGFTGVRQSR